MSTGDDFPLLVSPMVHPMYIVTAASHADRSGCLVGFATQASMDPARMIVMLSKVNHTCRVSLEATELVVHFLHEDNHDLATLFGAETGDEVDKFSACEWQQTPAGTPVVRGTRGWIVGRILARLDAGDHVAHLLEVEEAHTDLTGGQLSIHDVSDIEPGHPA